MYAINFMTKKPNLSQQSCHSHLLTWNMKRRVLINVCQWLVHGRSLRCKYSADNCTASTLQIAALQVHAVHCNASILHCRSMHCKYTANHCTASALQIIALQIHCRLLYWSIIYQSPKQRSNWTTDLLSFILSEIWILVMSDFWPSPDRRPNRQTGRKWYIIVWALTSCMATLGKKRAKMVLLGSPQILY